MNHAQVKMYALVYATALYNIRRLFLDSPSRDEDPDKIERCADAERTIPLIVILTRAVLVVESRRSSRVEADAPRLKDPAPYLLILVSCLNTPLYIIPRQIAIMTGGAKRTVSAAPYTNPGAPSLPRPHGISNPSRTTPSSNPMQWGGRYSG